jgi:hypothetical protein
MEERLKEIANSVTKPACQPQIICRDWSECSEGFQKRICRDVAGCTTGTSLEVRECQTASGNEQSVQNITYRLTGGAGNVSGNKTPGAVGLVTGIPIGVNEAAGIGLILLFLLLAAFAVSRKKKNKFS